MPKTPEGYVLASTLDWLAAKHILAFRMNTGAVKTDTRFFRFGVPGMADVLAFPVILLPDLTRGGAGKMYPHPSVLWIECKAAKGKQSDLQRSFQAQVEAEGHRYIIVRSIDDLEAAFPSGSLR